MNTIKELYKHLALMGIFLPKEKLEEVYRKIQLEANKSIWAVLYMIEKDESLKVYTDPEKGAFQIEEELVVPKLSKPIIKLEKKTGNQIQEFHSAYAAAKSLGLSKDEVGNILQVCEGKRKSAYGFNWKFAVTK